MFAPGVQRRIALAGPTANALIAVLLLAVIRIWGMDGDHLVFSRSGRPDRTFRPELKDLFFEAGQPRSRRLFQRDAAGAITGFVDRREERDILWRRAP